MMNLDLSGKHAMVCGSTRGIGWASAQQLVEMGAHVTLVARDESLLKQRVEQLGGSDHSYICVDFSEPESVGQRVHNWVADRPVHILINNTGGPPGGSAHEADIEEYVEAFKRHLLCNQLLVKATIRGMREAGYGRIINIISTSVREPIPGLGVSNTIRGAVAAWAKTLSNELGPDAITVNNVLPGFTSTDRLDQIIDNKAKNADRDTVIEQMKGQVPLRRFADPSELANVIAFLASPAAGYVNGVSLAVDGGRTKSI